MIEPSGRRAYLPLGCVAAAAASAPLVQDIGGIRHQSEMQRHHRQGCVFQVIVGATHQIARDDDTIIVIAGVERGVEDAAIGEAAIEHERFDAHVAQQEIEIGRIKRRQPPLVSTIRSFGCDVGDEFGPWRAFDGMGVAVGNFADIKRKRPPPC